MTKIESSVRTTLNANDLVEHNFFPNVQDAAPVASAGGPSEQVRALMDRTWKGRVTIVQAETLVNPSTERYATVFVCFHGRVATSWCSGDEHTFDARTGLCIESSDGRMKGWRIAPWEMFRFNMVDAQAYIEANKTNRMSIGDEPVIAAAAAPSIADGVELSELRDVRHASTLATTLVVVSGSFGTSESTDAATAIMHSAGLSRADCVIRSVGESCVGLRISSVVSTTDILDAWNRSSANECWRWWRTEISARSIVATEYRFVSFGDVSDYVRKCQRDRKSETRQA